MYIYKYRYRYKYEYKYIYIYTYKFIKVYDIFILACYNNLVKG